MNRGLYIHVPFCQRKCRYCDFYSVTGLSPALSEEYVNAVLRNIRAAGDIAFDTVYFGGGTPSLLTAGQISEILSAVNISENAEISMECNPNSTSEDYFGDIRRAGVNRISIGVQSLCNDELKSLGRLHNADEARAAVISAHGSGFENISADLMLGISGQTREKLMHTIEAMENLPLTHISAYMLKVEEGTPLSRNEELLKEIPSEEETAEMYLLAVNALKEKGFEQYEISNFAVNGFECRHNLKYWQCGEYLGIGPAAHSYMNGVRFEVPGDLGDFLQREHQRETVTDESPGGLAERLMLSLRLREGFPLNAAGERAERLRKTAIPMERAGLLNIDGSGNIALTPEGFLVSNEIILRLTEAVE